MNKNLKKVISAVAALALSVTSFAALAAYPDVPADNKYASAVNELSALGIIEGFEDGTFHPDELVTRAQMAKMVVSALNVSNAESNKVQKFNDVPADNWAAGWIATATDQGILNGTGNGNFDPDLNVTYAQTAKMLVAAAGYEQWASRQGGWPSGYLYYAGTTGITNGVTGVSNDTALTRAQCAQMIANALEVPMLQDDSMSYDYQGNPVAIKIQKDGTTDDKSPFTSLLIENWNIYSVNGKVTDTGKDSTSGNTDKLTYRIEKTKNYQGTAYNTSSMYNNEKDTVNEVCTYGESGADNFLNIYTKALILADDYTDPEIIYIEEAGKSESLTFNSNLYSSFATGTNYDTLKVKRNATTSTTTSYKLANQADNTAVMVVNGVEVGEVTEDLINTYIRDNKGVEVTLTDNPQGGSASTDGNYDVITVDYKGVAVVDGVSERSDKITVTFKNQNSVIGSTSRMEIRLDDTNYKYTFTDTEGKAVDVKDLKENDVLLIAFNPTGNFKDSTYYDVEVCNATVEGKITGQSTNAYDEPTYTIAGTEYTAVEGMVNVKVGSEYTAYMTSDNRIAYVDKISTAVNYGVLDRVYKSSTGDDTVRIIDKTGVKRTYEIDLTKSTNDPEGKAAALLTVNDKDWEDKNGSKGTADYSDGLTLEERIVSYTITSSNEIRLKDSDDITAEDFTGEYIASTKRLDSYIVDDATVILDLCDWWADGRAQAAVASAGAFVDATEYSGVAARDTASSLSESVPFVVITSGLGGWSVDTQMAVIIKTSETNVDSMPRTQLLVAQGGEEVELTCEDNSSTFTSLTEGTAIVYKKDSDGYVDEVYTVLNDDLADLANVDKYDFFKAILGSNTSLDARSMAGTDAINPVLTDKTSDPLKSMVRDGEYVEFILAPVLEKDTGSVTIGGLSFGQVGNKADTTGKDAYYTDTVGRNYAYKSDVSVATYTQENSAKYRVEIGNGASVVKSSIGNASDNTTSYLDKGGKYVNLGMDGEDKNNGSANSIAFVLLKVHDRNVQAAYSIELSENNDAYATFR